MRNAVMMLILNCFLQCACKHFQRPFQSTQERKSVNKLGMNSGGIHITEMIHYPASHQLGRVPVPCEQFSSPVNTPQIIDLQLGTINSQFISIQSFSSPISSPCSIKDHHWSSYGFFISCRFQISSFVLSEPATTEKPRQELKGWSLVEQGDYT